MALPVTDSNMKAYNSKAMCFYSRRNRYDMWLDTAKSISYDTGTCNFSILETFFVDCNDIFYESYIEQSLMKATPSRYRATYKLFTGLRKNQLHMSVLSRILELGPCTSWEDKTDIVSSCRYFYDLYENKRGMKTFLSSKIFRSDPSNMIALFNKNKLPYVRGSASGIKKDIHNDTVHRNRICVLSIILYYMHSDVSQLSCSVSHTPYTQDMTMPVSNIYSCSYDFYFDPGLYNEDMSLYTINICILGDNVLKRILHYTDTRTIMSCRASGKDMCKVIDECSYWDSLLEYKPDDSYGNFARCTSPFTRYLCYRSGCIPKFRISTEDSADVDTSNMKVYNIGKHIFSFPVYLTLQFPNFRVYFFNREIHVEINFDECDRQSVCRQFIKDYDIWAIHEGDSTYIDDTKDNFLRKVYKKLPDNSTFVALSLNRVDDKLDMLRERLLMCDSQEDKDVATQLYRKRAHKVGCSQPQVYLNMKRNCIHKTYYLFLHFKQDLKYIFENHLWKCILA